MDGRASEPDSQVPASRLANPTSTRTVLDRFGLATKKRLGQNFLVDDSVIARILDLAELGPADSVLEVGPGIGTLTIALLDHAGAVVSLEADRELERVLASTCADGADRFALVMGDALKATPATVGEALEGLERTEAPAHPTEFVSNLPYQVAATVLLRFLQTMPTISRAVVMVQAEVADRISASPGTKAYGAYTAKLALQGMVTGRFEVGPGCFMPPPHVNSAVVRIDRHAPVGPGGACLTPEQVAATASVIDAAFAQRRKTIRNSMSSSGFDKAALDVAFEESGIDAGCRAETLPCEAFVGLALALGGNGRGDGATSGKGSGV
ncbi:MAG: 16S rRNA (adenine(1518)-N(6)/adenine(1519)-N(6))-dimethyltransferase RsmA [Atopobiaceae bacterium]|nr:16S rRNA (adenine(1518)-N(6)/adenine(1519)-N(6))-dimethyltransferase RsmA [Atopobiaceae bacterium]MCI2207906.1 16S rRNA (adenine(1518)-N(6)/adenine(1519)-N(6))-dimethyltransferase RsmA [Atopobiaceae bacterium]